jgi:predicted RNA-binding protein (virulence factor B family)
MIKTGQKNKLKAVRYTPSGWYLADEENQEVLLPNKYAGAVKAGDVLDVFIYTDSEDRIIATTLQPLAEANTFAYLKVKSVSPIGAFLDWGLEKDLLVPFREQLVPMHENEYYVVRVYLDVKSQRLAASTKISKFLANDEIALAEGEEVQVMVFGKSGLGFKVIINDKHEGLIYQNEVFRPIETGQRFKAFIKMIRADKKIDVTLQKAGFEHVNSFTTTILEYLQKHQGFLALTDQSSPDEIASLLNMSKKNFKKSVGVLYKQQKIQLHHDGIYLVNQ